VRDFGRLIQLVIEAPRAKVAFEVFNAGGEVNNLTKQGVIDTILTLLPNSKVRYQEHGMDPRNYRVNFGKVKKIIGFEPQYTIKDGVKELLGAIQEHVFDQVDIRKNFHGNYEIEYDEL
jgi:nucleoside-diphosphate-sugar epimerase